MGLAALRCACANPAKSVNTAGEGNDAGTGSSGNSASVAASGNTQAGDPASAAAPGNTQAGNPGEAADDGTADGNGTYDIDNQSGDNFAPQGQPSAEASSAWDGTYVSEEGETLTISTQDEGTISFAFANSGISSTAFVTGNGASYDGDDNMDVEFTLSGDVIGVSVMNVETGEAEVSAITGTYERQ